MLALRVDTEKTHQTKFGAFPHKNLVGKRFGTKVCVKKFPIIKRCVPLYMVIMMLDNNFFFQ